MLLGLFGSGNETRRKQGTQGTYTVNTFQNRNLDERKLLGSTSGIAKTGEFVGHYRGTLLKAAKKFSPSFSVIRMGSRGTFVLCTTSSRCDAAEKTLSGEGWSPY